MILLRYGLVFLATALGVGFAVTALGSQTASGISSSLQLMVPAMIAALVEGMQAAKRDKVPQPRAAAWRFAVPTMVVATALNVVLAYRAGAIAPEFAKLAIAAPYSKQFNMLLLIYAGAYLLCNRFLFSLGAANHLNTMRQRGEIE